MEVGTHDSALVIQAHALYSWRDTGPAEDVLDQLTPTHTAHGARCRKNNPLDAPFAVQSGSLLEREGRNHLLKSFCRWLKYRF